ncbi:hypothetical protein ACFS07_16585 [Undibacterium arcticum]
MKLEASVSKAGPAVSGNALAVAIVAALAIIGASVPDLIWLYYCCKPLTTLMIFPDGLGQRAGGELALSPRRF